MFSPSINNENGYTPFPFFTTNSNYNLTSFPPNDDPNTNPNNTPNFPMQFLDDDNEFLLMMNTCHFLPNREIPASAATNGGDVAHVQTKSTRKKVSDNEKKEKVKEKEKITRKRSTGKKDRHSKIYTAQGPRDRRMRLSLQVARKFFDLQDILGFDKASKTIEWLFCKSKPAINDLMADNSVPNVKFSCKSSCDNSESEVVDIVNHELEDGVEKTVAIVTRPIRRSKCDISKRSHNPRLVDRESREKARARARERTKMKMKMRPSFEHNMNTKSCIQEMNSVSERAIKEEKEVGKDENKDEKMDSLSFIEKFLGINGSNNIVGYNSSYDQGNLSSNNQYSYSSLMGSSTGNFDNVQLQNPNFDKIITQYLHENVTSTTNSSIFVKEPSNPNSDYSNHQSNLFKWLEHGFS